MLQFIAMWFVLMIMPLNLIAVIVQFLSSLVIKTSQLTVPTQTIVASQA